MIILKLENMVEIKNRLKAMPDKVQNRAISKALYAGGVIIKDAARAKAPRRERAYPVTRQPLASPARLAKLIVNAGKKGITIAEINNRLSKHPGRAKGNMNRIPGTLQKSIVIGRAKTSLGYKNKDYTAISVGLLKRAFYGYWVEKGFKHYGKQRTTVAARPFMAPALSNNADKVIKAFQTALAELINTLGG